MSGLPEFLLARIAEDEEVARAAVRWSEGATEWGDAGDPDWEHIARHDPSRVLAECEAKRRIINACTWFDYERVKVRPGVYEMEQIRRVRSDDLDACAEVLWHMASPYADHPDYDEAWRP